MKKIKSQIGNKLICKGWHQEAAMRMLNNNLDPDVAEDPENLIVYGGLGKAARKLTSIHLEFLYLTLCWSQIGQLGNILEN